MHESKKEKKPKEKRAQAPESHAEGPAQQEGKDLESQRHPHPLTLHLIEQTPTLPSTENIASKEQPRNSFEIFGRDFLF